MDVRTKLLHLSRASTHAQRKLKHGLERALGLKVLRALPLGNSVFVDLRDRLPGYRGGGTVFDVGANIGQTASDFAFWWPDARIFCFEPVAQNFQELRKNTADMPAVECLQIALADAPGASEMVLSGLAVTFRIAAQGPSNELTERVAVDTVDRVCERLNVTHISYLKVDTEGYDLKVLQGAGGMLDRGAIDLIEVEAGMNPENDLHVPLEQLKSFAEQHGYLLFGIYEQRHDWPTGRPILRRSNAVFLSRRIAETYRRHNT